MYLQLKNEQLDKLYKTIEFECRSNDRAVLRSYTQFATMAANELGIQIGKWYVAIFIHKS